MNRLSDTLRMCCQALVANKLRSTLTLVGIVAGVAFGIGAIVLNKDQFGSHYNRLAGVDANFRFGFLNVDGFATKTFSPAISPRRRRGSTSKSSVQPT